MYVFDPVYSFETFRISLKSLNSLKMLQQFPITPVLFSLGFSRDTIFEWVEKSQLKF